MEAPHASLVLKFNNLRTDLTHDELREYLQTRGFPGVTVVIHVT